MRILHSLDILHKGGIPELVLSLHQYSGHEHAWWAGDGTMSEELRAAGMTIWNGGPPPEEHYDVVVGHGVCGWSSHDLAGWAHSRGARIAECIHSTCRSITPPECLDGFIAMSNLTLNLNRHMPKAVCIYAPLDVSKFGNEHGNAIGKLGRLVDEKRPQDFIEIARHFPGEQFLLAGDGAMFSQLKQMAPGNLEMAGWVRDFPAFYSKLKLFVFPTRDECSSMSLARAQASGLPCIVQDIPPLRETTGGRAIFCNGIPEFVSAVNSFLSNPVQYDELGAMSKFWAFSAFDISTTIPAWDQYMESL